MRKRLLTLAAAAVVVLLLLPQPASAEECEHIYSKFDSCFALMCVKCGDIQELEFPSHRYESTGDGLHLKCINCGRLAKGLYHPTKCTPYQCEICGDEITDTISHHYMQTAKDTCSNTYTCVNCGDSYLYYKHKLEEVGSMCQSIKRCKNCDDATTVGPVMHDYIAGPLGVISHCRNCEAFYFSFDDINWPGLFQIVFCLIIIVLLIALVILAVTKPHLILRTQTLGRILAGTILVFTFAMALIPGVNDNMAVLLEALFPHRLYSHCNTTECGHCDLTLPFGNGQGHYYTTYKEIGCVEYRRCKYCGDEDSYADHSYRTVKLDGCTATQQCSSCKHIRYVTQHNYSQQNHVCSRCGIWVCTSRNGKHRFTSVNSESFDSLFLSKCRYCGYEVYLGTPHTICMLVLCILVGSLIISLVVLSIYIIRKKKYLAIHPGLFAGALMSGQLDKRFEGFTYIHEPSILYFYTRMTDD